MKICLYGAGAVGGHVAARLAAAGHDEVAVVARGAQLAAIRSRGLVLHSAGLTLSGRPAAATDDPATLPPQDLVFVTLKAHALPAAAAAVARLLKPEGCAVFAVNGIPWWWNHGRDGGALPLLDPGGRLWALLRQRALGCVIYSPNELEAPGVVRHAGANRWLMGEPGGGASERLAAALAAFNRAGLPAAASADIRREVWLKLVRNASNNTLSALTRLDGADIAADPELKQLAVALIRETLDVAAALGWPLHAEVDAERLAGRMEKGGTRSSMLQDVLLGRPLEHAAILGQTQAFARERGVAVPTIDRLLPLLRGLDRGLRAC